MRKENSEIEIKNQQGKIEVKNKREGTTKQKMGKSKKVKLKGI